MIESTIQQIKERLDIVEVIGCYIKLQKVGANYRALCPFHSEKTPSFFVSPSRQIWHCFGQCSEGGDIFKFIMKIEGIEFGDALRILAQKAGVPLRKQDPRLQSQRKRLYEICELATQFFQKQLQESKKGLEAKQYLLERGLKEETLKKWRLGFSPHTVRALTDFLRGRGYKEEEIIKSGLAFRSPSHSLEDRFQKRIIFPVFDFNSQPIGFGGRILPGKEEVSKKDEGIAKYINTPNTLLYDKSRVLYGLDKARVAIRKKDFSVLVEGYIDALMSSQSGIENVVASSGTALTSSQLQVLKRYSKNLVLAFDMDAAGDTATQRSISLAQEQGFNLKVVIMPQGKDPAEIAALSRDQWKKLVEGARDIMDFYFERTFAKFASQRPLGAEAKAKIADFLLPLIQKIPNKILQAHWLSTLANRIGVREEDLREELKKYSSREEKMREKQTEEQPSPPPKSRQEMLEERILSLLLQNPRHLELLDKDSLILFSPRVQSILKKFQEFREKRENLDFSDPRFLRNFKGEDADFLNYLSLRAEFEEISEPKQELTFCLRDFKNLRAKQKLEEISRKIKEAEDKKRFKEVEKLLEQFQALSKQISN